MSIELGDPAKLEAEVERFKHRVPTEPKIGPRLNGSEIVREPDMRGINAAATIERLRKQYPPVTDEQATKWKLENEILPNLIASQIPPRFHFEIRHWSEPKQKTVLDICRTLCRRTGAIIALLGPRGLGKTTIAAQMIWERATNEKLEPWERRPPYRKMTDLISRFKPLYADFGSIHSDELRERRDGFCKLHPLVIIDELRECEDQRLKDRILTDIIDRRYSHRNDTILISNETAEEFQKSTNDSVLSRLSEHGRIIECNWASFREGN